MKILKCIRPGFLQYESADIPVPTENETLLRVKNIGICGTDLHAIDGTQPYFSYPRILGHEISAEVVESRGSADLRAGQRVTFLPYDYCGQCGACLTGRTNCCAKLQVFGVHKDGGMCEYLVVPSRLIVSSDVLSFESLATIEPLAIGAHAIRRADVTHGEFVLVIGAGPIGLGVMQFAGEKNATVIAMDINDSRLSFCKDTIGVPFTLQAGLEDLHDRLLEITNGHMPDVVFDATGNLTAINGGFKFLSHGGRYVLVGLQKGDITFSHPEFHKREATLMSSRNATRDDFVNVMDSIVEGRMDPSLYITHRVDFDGLAETLPLWGTPSTGVIKGMATL